MSTIINATFDGTVFRPNEPVELAPNTVVQLEVRPAPVTPVSQQSFLDTAISLNLVGPPDWSENLDHYLYGEDAPTGS